MESSRQEYWNGLPFPTTEALPDPRITLVSPALQADSLPTEPLGKPQEQPHLLLCVKFNLLYSVDIWVLPSAAAYVNVCTPVLYSHA